MNGNIFNYSLVSEQYTWNCGWFGCDSAKAIPPNSPANTINGESIFTQSYINAYNTAFNRPVNSQRALYRYKAFTSDEVNNNNFVPGTFGYQEEYNNGNNGETFRVGYLINSINNHFGAPYLFVSAGSYGGSGYMYLDWIIATYGVPYVVSVS